MKAALATIMMMRSTIIVRIASAITISDSASVLRMSMATAMRLLPVGAAPARRRLPLCPAATIGAAAGRGQTRGSACGDGDVEADVERRRRVGDPAAGNVIDAGLG